jgi:hypothetical protein
VHRQTTYIAQYGNWHAHQSVYTTIISKQTIHDVYVGLLMRNTHCQPLRPFLPSMVLCIAVIMIPANMLPSWPTAVKIAVRFAISDGLLSAISVALLRAKPTASVVWYDLLPRSNNVYGTTIQTSLHEALEKSHSTELLVCLASRRAHGQTGPEDQRGG